MKLERGNPLWPPAELERGVNFFVLALESAGAKPLWSCEGHPRGFMVGFNAPVALAERIVAAGYFRVSLRTRQFTKKTHSWVMDISTTESGFAKQIKKPWTEREKAKLLRRAAAAWVEAGFWLEER